MPPYRRRSKAHLTYGTRRLKPALSAQNRTVSRRRIGRLMREAELVLNCINKRHENKL
ncbi:IS3 family transposase [Methylomonas sp. DH-1]|uniref:IS3 family transposase n=1 Tax=Methylomonas sp. (strain DH-1) TaxID=1727196 RepID=UPI0009EDDA56